MAKCPNEDCKENFEKKVDGHSKTLYGPDGTGGVVACIKSKVSKKTMAFWTLGLLGVLTTVTIAGLNSWGQAKDERKENKSSIAVIQNDVQNKFNALEKSMDEIKSKQIDPKELLMEIRNIIHEKKEPGGYE